MSLRKCLCLILALSMLLSFAAGCAQQEGVPTTSTNDPTSSQSPTETVPGDGDDEVIYKPQRPPDPGVVPPLPENNDFPENGIVWDMESIPDDLVASNYAAGKYGDNADFVAGNISFLGVDGKGYEGSRALAVRQNGNYVWADVYRIGIRTDKTSYTKWSEEMFWFWYDSTDCPASMTMEMEINDTHMPIGTEYFVMAEGETVAQLAGTMPEGYTGAGYARIPLLGNFKGWIGFPTSAFSTDLKRVASFTWHITNIPSGRTLYIDNFCLTSADEGPYGATLSRENKNVASADKPVWDMEKLPSNLLDSYWAVKDNANSVEDPSNFQVLAAAGKGVGGSTALRLLQKGKYHWADGVTISLTNDSSALNNWESGDILWFYADTTELYCNAAIDLWIDNKKAEIGSAVYGINEAGDIVKVYDMEEAWTNAGYGRIKLGAGYKGWVGVPLSAYPGEIVNVMNLYFHVGYSGETGSNRSIYLDEFWVLKEGVKPKTAFGANVDALAGNVPVDGPPPEETPEPAPGPDVQLTLPAEIWNVNNLPSDPIADGWAVIVYKDAGNYESGHTALSIVSGKGYQGSAAIKIQQLTGYHWGDVFDFDLTKDSSAVTLWGDGNKILWFYVDASEHTSAVCPDIMLGENKIATGSECYLVADGASSGTVVTVPEAWSGAGYGRFNLPVGFKGWVGAKLSSWGSGVYGSEKIRFHIGYSSSDIEGKSVYFDSFWITENATAPNGVKADGSQSEPSQPAKPGFLLWDAENASTSNMVSSTQNGQDTPVNSHFPGNVIAMGVDGKGYNGSKALGYAITDMNSNEYWGNHIKVHWERAGFNGNPAYDWTGYEMLWVWVDTSDYDASLSLRIKLEGKSGTGAKYYFWNGQGEPVEGGTITSGNPNWERMPLESGYKGWIGVELGKYVTNGLKLNEVWDIEFYFEPWDEATADNMIYIDELWLTSKGKTPEIS